MAIAQSKETATGEFSPPPNPVKLMFIHHSVGGHWLAHDKGGLVNELNENNYYVNDITYGWEPAALTNTIPKKLHRFFLKFQGKLFKSREMNGAYNIGNRTDIGHMPDWFIGPDSKIIMEAVYKENLETDRFGDHSNNNSASFFANLNPAMENEIIMFKSCYPNTQLLGKAKDPPTPINQPLPPSFSAGSNEHTVSNAKRVFNDLLSYFQAQQNKFFVITTPPPLSDLPKDGEVARGFSNWLMHDWLKQNNYTAGNVMVFDLYNVLTSGYDSSKNDAGESNGNHHRVWNGKIQHTVQTDNDELVYSTAIGDDHPSPAGLKKATEEFVPLLNYYYGQWKNEKISQ